MTTKYKLTDIDDIWKKVGALLPSPTGNGYVLGDVGRENKEALRQAIIDDYKAMLEAAPAQESEPAVGFYNVETGELKSVITSDDGDFKNWVDVYTHPPADKDWISVKDRLPEVSKNAKDFQLASGESDRVVVFMDGYEHIATYHNNIHQWSIPWHHGNWKPTHWMPLPQPPNEAMKG